MPLEAFNLRLREAGESGAKALLKSLGYETPEALGAVLKVAKDTQQASLSETQKLQQTIDELKPKAELADKRGQTLERVVKSQFDALPENVRTAIDDVAKGDAEQRATMMDVFRKAGVIGAQPAGATGAPAPNGATGAPQHPALASTSTAGPPPAPASVKSKFDEWQDLEKKNPTMAGIFYDANRLAIEKSRPAETATT